MIAAMADWSGIASKGDHFFRPYLSVSQMRGISTSREKRLHARMKAVQEVRG
jgi:hypothetical protein